MICNEIVHLDADNNVLIEVLDGRSVRLTFEAHPLEILYCKKKVTAIHVNNTPYLSLIEYNKIFITVNERLHTYVITEIDKISDNCFQAHTMPRTKSSFFITPILGVSRNIFRWGQYFVNTFIKDDKIIILFRYFNTEDFKQFEYSVTKYPFFEKIIDYDTQHVAMQFRIPLGYENEVKMFMEGKYSKMSTDYREHILKFHSLAKDCTIAKILFKDDSRRRQLELDLGVSIPEDVELYDKPGEIEIFKTI